VPRKASRRQFEGGIRIPKLWFISAFCLILLALGYFTPLALALMGCTVTVQAGEGGHTVLISYMAGFPRTYEPGEGVWGFTFGDSISVQAKPDTPYYSFKHWTLSFTDGSPPKDELSNPLSLMVVKNIIILAVFNRESYPPETQRYHLYVSAEPYQGGTTNPPVGSSLGFDAGTYVTVTATANPGYIFDRWIKDGQVTGITAPSYTILMNSDHYLVAKFRTPSTPQPRTLTILAPSGYGHTSPSTGTYTYSDGATALVYAYPDAGNSFLYWKLDGTISDTISPTRITMNKDYTLQAFFTSTVPPTTPPPTTPPPTITYSLWIQVMPSGAGTTFPQAGQSHVYNASTSVVLKAYVNSGYEFVQWKVGGSSVGAGSGSDHAYTLTMNKNYEVLAEFREVEVQTFTLRVVVNPSGAGSISPYSVGNHSIKKGQSITLTATANSGYKFVKWYMDNIAQQEGVRTLTVVMDKNHDVLAGFSPEAGTYQGILAVTNLPTAAVLEGRYFNFTIQVTNTGLAVWTPETVFVRVQEGNWGTNRILLAGSVSPGTSSSREAGLTAPMTGAGNYDLTLQLVYVQDGSAVPFGNIVSKKILVGSTVAPPGNVWDYFRGWLMWLDLQYSDPDKLVATMMIPDCAKYRIDGWGELEKINASTFKVDIDLKELVGVSVNQNNRCNKTHTYISSTSLPNNFIVQVYSHGIYLGVFTFQNGKVTPPSPPEPIFHWPEWFTWLLVTTSIGTFLVGALIYPRFTWAPKKV